MDANLAKYVLGVAAKSNIEKRRVGCVITDGTGRIVSEGFNIDHYHAEYCACENLVANAEQYDTPLTAYVTHQPCPECAKTLINHGVTNVVIVEEFMKFDGDKVRYDLITPEFLADVAKVLTFGAKKYKPNNWRNNTDLDRYFGAAMRHMEAARSGELLDSETGLPHLAHATANMMFLHHLCLHNKDDSQK